MLEGLGRGPGSGPGVKRDKHPSISDPKEATDTYSVLTSARNLESWTTVVVGTKYLVGT